MALDTRSKRASAALLGIPFRPTLPIADGTVAEGDRLHALLLCSAVIAEAPDVAVAGHFHALNFNTTHALEIFSTHAFDIDTEHSLEGAQ